MKTTVMKIRLGQHDIDLIVHALRTSKSEIRKEYIKHLADILAECKELRGGNCE